MDHRMKKGKKASSECFLLGASDEDGEDPQSQSIDTALGAGQEAEVQGTTLFPKFRRGPSCADPLHAWDLSFPSWGCLYCSPADPGDT